MELTTTKPAGEKAGNANDNMNHYRLRLMMRPLPSTPNKLPLTFMNEDDGVNEMEIVIN